MARRLSYIGTPVITLEQVAQQCRIDAADLESDLINLIIIPGVIAQAEAKSGAAIQTATYEEDWPASRPSGSYLDIGQAQELVKLKRIEPDGSLTVLTDACYLQRGQRETALHFPNGRPSGMLRITYSAGLDMEAYPSVRSWLLMHAASAYEQRETLIVGLSLTELPASYLDVLLAEITLPPRF